MIIFPGNWMPAGAGAVRSALRLGEAAAAIVIVALVARAVLLVFAPLPAPPLPDFPAAVAAGRVDASALPAGGHPFMARQGDPALRAATPLEESALGIVLYGTWRGGGEMAALLSAYGAPQKKVAVGEEIVAGVRLADVRDEYVVINNQGTLEAVAIVNRKVDLAAIDSASVNGLSGGPPIVDAPAAPVSLEGAQSSTASTAAPFPDLRDVRVGQIAVIPPLRDSGSGADRMSEPADAAIPNATE